MSYLVLARKWRPQTFDGVVGQGPVVRTLKNALKRGRVAHAMLFSGVRGVGKTTLARIMAKAINCQGSGDPPCNCCESCREITEGAALDLHEVDGASNRGIQEIRDLKENIRFLPTKNKFKIIIIDEVHMLTMEAFNALLKTLEEPPAHVYFMFATTELHKVPVTILSRCQRYELKRVLHTELVTFFRQLADAEGVAVENEALAMIARAAEGSVRDGLSLLEQIFSFCGSEVTVSDVSEILGVVDRQVFERMMLALLTGDLGMCFELLNRSHSYGIDLKRFGAELIGGLRALLICRTTSRPEMFLDVSDRELLFLKETSANYSAETLYGCFAALMKGVEEMQYAQSPRLALELALIRTVQTGQVAPVGDLLARLGELAGGTNVLSVKAAVSPNATAELAPLSQIGGENRKFLHQEKNGEIKGDTSQSAPPAPEPPISVAPSIPLHIESSSQVPLKGNSGLNSQTSSQNDEKTSIVRDVRQYWNEFVDHVMARKRWMAHALRLCSIPHEEGQELVLRFSSLSDCRILQGVDNLKLLTEFAQNFFQKTINVRLQFPEGSVEGLTEKSGESPQEERRALGNDPIVHMTAEIFSGRVATIRTGPPPPEVPLEKDEPTSTVVSEEFEEMNEQD